MSNILRKLSNEEKHIELISQVLNSIQDHVESNLEKYFKDPKKAWQPSTYFPSIAEENDLLKLHREAAKNVSIEQLIVLVGDTITEDALPTYSAWLRSIVDDKTGTSDAPLAIGSRRWSAEERRHGSLLDMHLRVDQRVNMAKVELTTQYLISEGFNTKATDPIEGFVYTSFQERATWISHSKLGNMIGENNIFLRDSSRAIAADEKKHEEYYKTVLMQKIFEVSPELAIVSFANMMKTKIDMPAISMRDGENLIQEKETLFEQFSKVAQKIGVYTAKDYVTIIQHLTESWNVEKLIVSGENARKAKDYILNLPSIIERAARNIESKMSEYKVPKFSWINYASV